MEKKLLYSSHVFLRSLSSPLRFLPLAQRRRIYKVVAVQNAHRSDRTVVRGLPPKSENSLYTIRLLFGVNSLRHHHTPETTTLVVFS